MAIFTVGARLHDYGKGTPDELFGKVSADGFACVQLAYKKCVPGVASYADVTPQLVQNTLEAQKKHNIAVAVLGTYVELAIADEVQRSANAADFKSQLAVCKALNAGCIGTETTGMHKQPAGTTRERAQYMLCKSLETILPEAERLGVTVAIEPVVGDSTNTPQAARHILDMMQSPALGVILDMSNLVSFEGKDNQQPLWDAMGELLGDKIKAVHFKGKNFAPDGTMLHTSLEDSCTDYAGAFAMLRTLLSCTDGSSFGIACQDEFFDPLTCIGGTITMEDGVLRQSIDVRFPTAITGEELIQKSQGMKCQQGIFFLINSGKRNFKLFTLPGKLLSKHTFFFQNCFIGI